MPIRCPRKRSSWFEAASVADDEALPAHGPYPRLFARFKILLDPMFPDLQVLFTHPVILSILDAVMGFQPSGCFPCFPRQRLRVSILIPNVLGLQTGLRDRGSATVGKAPDLPAAFPDQVDTVLMLDMIHLISDDELRLTLQRLHRKILPEGKLILRTTVPSQSASPGCAGLKNCG